MHERENALKEWLLSLTKNKDYTLNPLAGDASFRNYFRLEYSGLSQIVMDAPPEKENIQAFVNIAKTFRQAGIVTPEILAENKAHGFLLLSDLGNILLLDKLNLDTMDGYYAEAIHTLFKIQACPLNETTPLFDHNFMLSEMNLCSEWFFKTYLSLKLKQEEQDIIENTFKHLANTIGQQAQVFIHRDYHSRNLMLVNDNVLGVIDFQDAMVGPFTYDLVSLLKDCYISWPRAKVLDWVRYFFSNSALCQSYSLPQFIRAFDFCGLQRHLKVVGIFSRLAFRDNKPGYLKHLPLTLNYILECTLMYEELHPFYQFLKNRVHLP